MKGHGMEKIIGNDQSNEREYTEDYIAGNEEYTEADGYAEEGYYTEDGRYVQGFYAEDGRYVECYYTEDGWYVESYYTEDGRYVEDYYTADGEYVESFYPEEGGYAEEYDAYAEEADRGDDVCVEDVGEGDDVYEAAGDTGDVVYAEDCYSEEDEIAEDYDAGEDGATEDYYAGEGYYTEDGEYVENGYDAEEEEYVETGYDESDESDRDEEAYVPFSRGVRKPPKKKKNKFGGMNVMDIVMMVAGVAVLVLAVVVGSMFLGDRRSEGQISAFADVGSQLADITTIGGAGIQAVANAAIARQEGIFMEKDDPEEDDGNYGENNYDRQVSIVPDFTSIQKDLKIKFLNEKTDKLVANVPFSVMVTGPDGKQTIWSDDDMDGIIYKKDIEAGKYKIVMEKLADSRYAEYAVATAEKVTEVRDKITYVKVDVSNEVIEESEIDASKEDTKKNEVEVESTIQDTVQWVESKVIPSTYNQVAKSTIPDPITLVYARSLILTSQENTGGAVPTEAPAAEPTVTPTEAPAAEPTAAPTEVPTAEPTAAPTEVPTAEPTAVPTEVPTAEPTAVPTAAPTAEPTAAPTPGPTPAPTATPVPPVGSVTVAAENLKTNVGKSLSNQAAATGFAEGSKVVYSISGNNAQVASAIIDSAGVITISALAEGNVTFTVTANYENGQAATQGTATFSVTVLPKMALSVAQPDIKIFLEEPKTVTAIVSNALTQDGVFVAETSDAGVAMAKAEGSAITITPYGEGTATLMLKYTENGETIEYNCEITVRQHPRNNTTSLLKDAEGRQLYVLENDKYRQATYADYYTADKFFVCGEAKYTGWQMLDGKMYFFDANGVKVTGQQTIQGAIYDFAEDGSLLTGSGVVGIDVSKWNKTIDWDAVANSGISYVIIRCGYRGSSNGKLVVDPKYTENIKGALRAGLEVGVYFFSQAINEVEAVEEASMVLDLIKNYDITYPVFLDVETSGGRGDKIDKATRTAVCRAFCETIESEGYKAGIYSNKQWLEKKLEAGALEEYKIWLAQYAATPTYAGIYDMWQYTATGSVNGITGHVDLNISYLGY